MEPRRVALKPDWLGQKPDLPWEWVESRLTAERNFWLVSVRRDGHPQARPVWGIWSSKVLFLSLMSGGLRRTPMADGQPVAAHTDSATSVTIIEGSLQRIANPRVGAGGRELGHDELVGLVTAWNQKYHREWTAEHHGFNFALDPRAVLAWREDDSQHSADASGKWEF